MSKLPVCFFTVADKNNLKFAKQLENSLKKFHPDIPFFLYTEEDVGDPINYYRQKPMFARNLIKKYDLVIGADADQIITGSLDYILKENYEVGCVMNYNRTDPKKYGLVGVWDILPQEYMNAGFVAMRSERFILNWWRLCNSAHFNNAQYKEQDLMNIIIHYGDFKVECFDVPNAVKNYHAWHGLVSKGEWDKMIMKDGKLILPKTDDNYPEEDKEIKVLHSAGGGNEKKIGDSYRLYFSDEVIDYLEGLIK